MYNIDSKDVNNTHQSNECSDSIMQLGGYKVSNFIRWHTAIYDEDEDIYIIWLNIIPG